MNYLAHIYLSGDHPEVMIGGLLGDFVKGPLRGQLPRAIEEGIELHRKIDVFTDSLPEVKQAVVRIEPPYRRFGGILIDICYDHFLAANWSEFHPNPWETTVSISIKCCRSMSITCHPQPSGSAPSPQKCGGLKAMLKWKTLNISSKG